MFPFLFLGEGLIGRRKAPAAKKAPAKAPAKNLKQTQLKFGSSQAGGRRK